MSDRIENIYIITDYENETLAYAVSELKSLLTSCENIRCIDSVDENDRVWVFNIASDSSMALNSFSAYADSIGAQKN